MGALQDERNKLFLDLLGGKEWKKPARVPFQMNVDPQAALEYFGYNVRRDSYSAQKCYEAADKMCELIDTDTLPCNPGATLGTVFRYIGQKFMVPGEDGFFQHPNFSPMEFNEYEKYIKNPYEFIVGTLHPRVFEVFDDEYPELAHIRIRIARQVGNAEYAGMVAKLKEKYQREDVFVQANLLWAPFDFVADYVRSFTTILTDMKRAPQLVIDACEATADYLIHQIKTSPAPVPGKISNISFPLHMAPYMSTKDVEKFYWPTFVKVIKAAHDHGYMARIHFEADWTPHMHLIADLPTGGPTIAQFENAKRDLILKYVPKSAVWLGTYPFTLIKTGKKQECIDEVKKVIDTLAVNGNYIFSPNTSAIRAGDVNLENMQAVIQCVKEYGKY